MATKRTIAVEFTLRLGSKKPRADLVAFPEEAEHKQEWPRILVECKSRKGKPSDRKEGVGQLQSYLSVCLNATFRMWTNGDERFCYRKVETSGKVEFAEIPDIPSPNRVNERRDREIPDAGSTSDFSGRSDGF